MHTTPPPGARDTRDEPGRAWSLVERLAPLVAIVSAAALLAVAWQWNTSVVGGSDSHCYVGQAEMFASGRLSLDPPIRGPVRWPDAPATFVPAGFTPSPIAWGQSVPLCPAGLSLLMALALKIDGPTSVFLVVPLLGALGVLATYHLARQLDGPIAGAVAAVWIACSPIALYQVVQPMSDVPAMAWWAAGLALAVAGRQPLLAGLAVSAAIMTRPNLAPLALVPAGLLILGPAPEAANQGRRRETSERARAALWFALGVAPGVGSVAWLQKAMYGSPFSSGYGNLALLFSLGHVVPNLTRYAAWLFSSHTPLVALAVVAPFLSPKRRELALLAVFAIGVLAAYLPYVVFDDWWYIRFLLPALPVVVAFFAIAAVRGIVRLGGAARLAALGAATALIAALWIHGARERSVFELKSLEQKYPAAGRFVANRLPTRAIVLAGQESGSVRYYSAARHCRGTVSSRNRWIRR